METVHLVVNEVGLIVNRIVKDGATLDSWDPGEGLIVLSELVEGEIGGSYIDGVYIGSLEDSEEE